MAEYRHNNHNNNNKQAASHRSQGLRSGGTRHRSASKGRNPYARQPGIRDPRVFMPLILLAAVVVTVGIALATRQSSKAARANEATTASTEADTQALVLQENAYPEVNELFRNYYTAMQDGDTTAIEAMSAELSDEEKIRISEIAKYIDSYPSIDVYTQTGPEDNSYICYVVTTMKFKDHDWEVPGMQTMYVCTNDEGTLYINNAHNQDKSVTDYIQKAALQDDVVDLNNKVTAEYNRLVADNADLSAYLNELSSNIDVSVGQALAQLAKEGSSESDTSAEAGTDSEEADSSASGSDAASSSGEETTGETVTANDTVNVRNAPSESADIIGTTTIGESYPLVQDDDGSGWYEITFLGQPGYVKAEFFTK